MADAPNIDFGAMAGKFVKNIVAGENIAETAKGLLTVEGERVCYEGAIQRLHNNRWAIFAGAAASVTGLIVLGSFIRHKVS